MRKVHLDTIIANMRLSEYVRDAEVVMAGTTVNAISVRYKKFSSYLPFLF